MEAFLANYMPMKFGSSLTSKLNKKNKDGQSYWERAEAEQTPFVLAIADFHLPGGNGEVGSMTYTQAALWPYLYGHRLEWEFVDGSLKTSVRKGFLNVAVFDQAIKGFQSNNYTGTGYSLVNAGKEWIKVGTSKVAMLQDPREKFVVVSFDQDYRSSNLSNVMRKRQYWAKDGGRWRILYEGGE